MSKYGVRLEILLEGERYSEEELELGLLQTLTQVTPDFWDLVTTGLEKHVNGNLGQDYILTLSQK